MAQNYTRQSSFSDGDTITASLFNNEYNQIVNAFSYSSSSDSSTGHKHDGNTGQGGNIPQIGDIDFNNKIVVDATNNRWGVYVEVSGSAVEQIRIQDGSIVPVTSNDIDLGTSSLQFKDLHIDGTANIDSLTLTSGSTVTVILDEDDLSTNSATALATQQSIKAYVDSQITGQSLNFSGDSGGSLSIDLDSEALTITGGTGIDTTGSTNDMSIAIDSTVATLTGSQTLTNKTLTSPDINGGTIDGATIGGSSAGNITYANLSDGTITITAFVDEDDMDSNSATLVPTQQSVKAYVDSKVTAEDLDFQADSGGALSIDLDSETMTFTGGTGIDTSGSGNAVTFAIDSTVTTLAGTQTLTNKTLTTPVITSISNSGTVTLPSGTTTLVGTATSDVLTNKTISGSSNTLSNIGNSSLSNSSVSFGGISVSLGSSDATPAFDLSDATGYTGDSSLVTTGTISSGVWQGTAVADTYVANDLTISGGTVNNTVIGGSSPAAADFTTVDTTGNATIGGNLAVTGNLTINGTTSTVNSTTVTIDDPIFTLGGDTTPSTDDNKDRGIEFKWHNGTGAKLGFFGYDDSASVFTFIPDASNTSEVFSGSAGNVAFGTVSGTSLDISGDIDVDGTANLDVVDIDGAVDMASTLTLAGNADFNGNLDVAGTTVSAGKITADAGIDIDNINIDGTTIALSSGDLTLDVAGDITFDADGGDWRFKDAGTTIATYSNVGGSWYITSNSQDGDIVFQGNDGGSTIVALTLNMSEAGEASFGSDVLLGDSKVLRFGADQDLRISFDGSNGIIQNVTGDSDIVFKGKDNTSIITALTLDMSDAGAASFNAGATFGGDIILPSTGKLYSSGDTDSYLQFNQANTLRAIIGDSTRMIIEPTVTVFNEDSAAVDFRVESTDNANMIKLDGTNNRVGIGKSPASNPFEVAGFASFDSGATFGGTVTATKLVSADGVLELDDNGTHNGVINAPATLFINIDSDANSTGEDFIVGKDRTGTSGGTELFRIESEGRVGIFNSIPGNYTGSGSNSLVLGNNSSTTGSHGMTIVAGNQATSSIAFSDHAGDGSTNDYRGLFQYVHADDSLRVFTASGERFRIMSGGDARFTLSADAVGSFTDEVGEVTDGTFCLQVANSAQSALKPLGFRAEDIRFATSAGERMRIASDGVAHFNGDVKVLHGDIQMGSGRGINFSASSNAGGMTSETLHDYEEGTFSATLAGSGSNPTVSYSGNTCKYTKVGNLVTVYITVSTSAFSGGSGDLHINGLPFTADGDSHGGAVSFYRVGSYTEVSPHIGGGTTRVVFLGRNTLTTSGTWNVLPTSAWSGSNPTIAQFSASYRTA